MVFEIYVLFPEEFIYFQYTFIYGRVVVSHFGIYPKQLYPYPQVYEQVPNPIGPQWDPDRRYG